MYQIRFFDKSNDPFVPIIRKGVISGFINWKQHTTPAYLLYLDYITIVNHLIVLWIHSQQIQIIAEYDFQEETMSISLCVDFTNNKNEAEDWIGNKRSTAKNRLLNLLHILFILFENGLSLEDNWEINIWSSYLFEIV